jgi:hypothetical protein
MQRFTGLARSLLHSHSPPPPQITPPPTHTHKITSPNRSGGSALVKESREKRDKNRARLKFWDMAGSKMGAITGLTEEEAAAAAALEAEVGRVCLVG